VQGLVWCCSGAAKCGEKARHGLGCAFYAKSRTVLQKEQCADRLLAYLHEVFISLHHRDTAFVHEEGGNFDLHQGVISLHDRIQSVLEVHQAICLLRNLVYFLLRN
jgi:hypothetical protein